MQRLRLVTRRTCRQQRLNGAPCSANPLRDSEFCIMHDPEHVQVIAEARRLGGLRRRREVTVQGAYDFEGLDTVPKIRRLVEIAVLDVLGLENSIARARALAYFAGIASDLLKTGELEDRVRTIEAILGNRTPPRGKAA